MSVVLSGRSDTFLLLWALFWQPASRGQHRLISLPESSSLHHSSSAVTVWGRFTQYVRSWTSLTFHWTDLLFLLQISIILVILIIVITVIKCLTSAVVTEHLVQYCGVLHYSTLVRSHLSSPVPSFSGLCSSSLCCPYLSCPSSNVLIGPRLSHLSLPVLTRPRLSSPAPLTDLVSVLCLSPRVHRPAQSAERLLHPHAAVQRSSRVRLQHRRRKSTQRVSAGVQRHTWRASGAEHRYLYCTHWQCLTWRTGILTANTDPFCCVKLTMCGWSIYCIS